MRKSIWIRFITNLVRLYQTDPPAIPGELPNQVILRSLRNLLTNIGGTLIADAHSDSDTSYKGSSNESNAAETIMDDYVSDDQSDPGTTNRIPSDDASEGDYYPPLDVGNSDEEMGHIKIGSTSVIVSNFTQSNQIIDVSDEDVDVDWDWDSYVDEDINNYYGLGDNKRNPIIID